MAKRDCSHASVKFVTGNQNKLKEMQAIVGDTVFVESVKIDLPELQGATPDDISKAKVRLAFEKVGEPVLIEDTSLCFEAMGGLPGPYVKWFFDTLGNEGLVKMLHDFPDKSANALCIFAYWDGVMESPILFKGITSGEIIMPIGNSGFGWDPIFKDVDSGLTFGQMDAEQKNTISHRKKALDKLKEYFAMSDKRQKVA